MARPTSSTTRPKLTAKTADKYALYEASVQAPADEVALILRSFRKLRGRAPKSLREDFCASASFACEWVKAKREHTAIGLDLDPLVLAWADLHQLQKLAPAARERIELREQDVLDSTPERFDVCCAYNYSYCVFKTRELLRAYFTQVRKALVKDGIFYLDLFGGALAQQSCVEPRSQGGFRFVWEQASYNPIDASIQCYIHFRFKDGTRIERAFSYDWRLWTIPELRELLQEAGFSQSLVYWEGSDAQGQANGKFSARRVVENDPAWNAYILALR